MFNRMKSITSMILIFLFVTCTPSTIQNSEDIKEILKIYAKENVMADEYIYYKSLENINQLKQIIGNSITAESFISVFTPVIDVQIETLISADELNLLIKKIENYYSIEWDQVGVNNLPIIKKDAIPDFHFEGGIPTKDQEIIDIHYISTPIINNNLSIIFFSKITSPLNASSGYYLLLKTNKRWKIVAENNVLITS